MRCEDSTHSEMMQKTLQRKRFKLEKEMVALKISGSVRHSLNISQVHPAGRGILLTLYL